MSGRDNVESSGDEQRKQTLGGACSGTTWVEVTHPLGMVLDPTRAVDPASWIARGFADPTPCADCGGTGVVWATTGEDYTCYRCVNKYPYVKQGIRYAEKDLGNPHPAAAATVAERQEVDENAYRRALGQPDVPEPGRHDGSSRTRDGPPGSGDDDDHRAVEEEEYPTVVGGAEEKDYEQKDYDDAEELMIQCEAQAKETRDYEQRMSWQQQHPEVDEKGNSPSRARSFPPFMIKHPDGTITEHSGQFVRRRVPVSAPPSSDDADHDVDSLSGGEQPKVEELIGEGLDSSIPRDTTCGGIYLPNTPEQEKSSRLFAERIARRKRRVKTEGEEAETIPEKEKGLGNPHAAGDEYPGYYRGDEHLSTWAYTFNQARARARTRTGPENGRARTWTRARAQ